MLHSIRRREEQVGPGDVVAALLECHNRIRHFTALATALPDATAVPPEEIASAAAGVVRYFGEALPLHSADEDESISPRFLAENPPDPIRRALAEMTRQHGDLDRTLAESMPAWRAIAADPGVLAEHAPALRRLAEKLRAQWSAHLDLEETIIFPALRELLPAPAQDEIRREMRARRGAAP